MEEDSFRASALARRDFLRLLGAGGVAALTFHPWEHVIAGPFTRADFDKLVPGDKKLPPEWVKSLTARGGRTTYRGSELKYIGMPVGGICAGQVYLGGDGKLWHWDIFNRKITTEAEHYAHPMTPSSPFDQGFALRLSNGGKNQERAMDARHWKDIAFIGEYPVGYVSYADSECPVSVSLEAFSPFIPLHVDDSSLPATIMEFTLKNHGTDVVEGELAGWLENAICHYSGQRRDGNHRNRVVRDPKFTFLECSAEEPASDTPGNRPDIVFDDFEGETYGNWSVTGKAFGTGPATADKMPSYQGDVGAHGKRLVNSHATAPGNNSSERDAATGKLTSRSFVVERNYITFLIGGGAHDGLTCVNLLVDDKLVLSTTGPGQDRLIPMSWDVRQWAGKSGHIEIVDEATGAWGNIGVDDIVFSDRPRVSGGPLADESDFGTMGLALLDAKPDDVAYTSLFDDGVPVGLFAQADVVTGPITRSFSQKLMGSVGRKFKLAPGESTKATFVLSWHMPNLRMDRLPPGRYYATRFDSARSVAAYLAKNFDRLAAQTRLWHDTWYDSTLPYWFLDRTFQNISTLATSTCHRFGNGRFYSWEGVGSCEGTCGHVWQYAHAVARLFPEFERQLREKVDFGLAMQPDGAIHFRGEFNNIPAIDAQAGVILRAYREHQMSVDAEFLKRNWPHMKKATEWLIAKDGDGDGLIESNQHNTLDTDWFGKVAWLSGLYLSALHAAMAMANEVGDQDFAEKCGKILNTGRKNFVEQLFNTDENYFINRVDAKHLDAINSETGCEIDQVMGQGWAFQVGLSRLWSEEKNIAALRSLWRYNFAPDVGPYRQAYKQGRWYAMPGEAGMLICTFPRSDWDYAQAGGKGGMDWAAGYFNECQNGYEYEVAGHMVWEGMITEGLAVTRAVHDRYHASRRNPWNEVECGDHYVRSMASYGIFIGACGYEYHGPKGRLAFAPRLTPENFKAPFTTAAGWGTFAQHRADHVQNHQLQMKYGELRLTTLAFVLAEGSKWKSVSVRLGNRTLKAQAAQAGSKVEITLNEPVVLQANEMLEVGIQIM